MLDIIIIGGGPVGSQTACQLARMGHTVAVLEQRGRLGGRVCCTGLISLECARAFAIDDSLILRRINSARLFSPSGELFYLRQKEPVACILDRANFDVFMARRAEQEGASYLLGDEVRLIEVAGDRVKVMVNQMGKVSDLEARAVVLATGSGSRLTRESWRVKDDFVMGAQAEVESSGIDEIEVYLGRKMSSGFFAWLVPTLPGKALVGLLSRHGAGSYLKKLLSSLKAQGKIVTDRVKLSYRGITLKPAARTYGDRLLVVGGAAGQAKPTTGGGIYYGMLCAEIAASSLHQALEKDDLSAENLASYEQKWKSRLGQEITAGFYARKFYEHLSDQQIDSIFKLATVCGLSESLPDAELSFDWHGSMLLKMLGNGIISGAVSIASMSLATEILGNE